MRIPSWISRKTGHRGTLQRQKRNDNCVQTVVAMLTGNDVEEIEQMAGTIGKMTVDETLVLLGRLGIYSRPVAASMVADFWSVFYQRHGARKLRGLGFALPKEAGKAGHAFLITGANMYDPATGDSEPINEESLKQLDWLALVPKDSAETA